ncbi:unnamed protein product [Trifolium pratense]|uniref:Uncharacterized protein n=1 Tax=Trifolium pratense TaxID=57577 RepID=A0ACB0K828_TRIPR|nr:unnamed protein product [Trifolium pratense]
MRAKWKKKRMRRLKRKRRKMRQRSNLFLILYLISNLISYFNKRIQLAHSLKLMPYYVFYQLYSCYLT